MDENLLTKEADETNETYNKFNNDIFERKSSLKHRLYLFRKTMHQHPLYYVIIKIIIGFLFLLTPFIIFLHSLHNSIGNFPVSQFSKSTIPLFLSVSLILFYLLILMFLKLMKVCKTIMFPSWDRLALGRIFEAIIIFIGVFYFLVKLMDSMSYIDNFTQKLGLLFQAGEIREFIFSKFTALSLILSDDSSNYNEKRRLLSHSHFMKNVNRRMRDNDPTFQGVNQNIIYQSIFELCNPILFLCMYFLIRLILFTSRNIILYMTMVCALLWEYCCIKYNLCKNDKIFCYFLPLTVFFISYFMLVIIELNHYLKKKIDYYEMKVVSSLFEVLNILALFLIVFTLCYCLTLRINSKIRFKLVYIEIDVIEYFMVKNTAVMAFLLYLFGNSFKLGDYLIELLFKPIQKELFPCKKKEFYRSKEELLAKKLNQGSCDIKESDTNSHMK